MELVTENNIDHTRIVIFSEEGRNSHFHSGCSEIEGEFYIAPENIKEIHYGAKDTENWWPLIKTKDSDHIIRGVLIGKYDKYKEYHLCYKDDTYEIETIMDNLDILEAKLK